MPDFRLQTYPLLLPAPSDSVAEPEGWALDAVVGAKDDGLIREQISFHGKGWEYFRIWIFNLLLTLLTLGVYLAWARVRTRRYFWGNTFIGERSFDYTASPGQLLPATLIVIGGLITYNLGGYVHWSVPTAALIAFFLLLPILLWLALRFAAFHTRHQGLRFRFQGSLLGSFAIYVGLPLLALTPFLAASILYWLWFGFENYDIWRILFGNFSFQWEVPLDPRYDVLSSTEMLAWVQRGLIASIILGLGLFPLWRYLTLRYRLGNLHFGSAAPVFRADKMLFYGMYFLGGLALAGLTVAAVIGIGAIETILPFHKLPSYLYNIYMAGMFILSAATLSSIYIGVIAGIRIFTAREISYHFSIGNLAIDATRLHMGRFIWIKISNLFLTILTLGLFLPFAKVRVTRYVLNHCNTVVDPQMTGTRAYHGNGHGSTGEAADAFLPFDVGW